MKIKTATFQTSAPDFDSCPTSDFPEFAFIGRSNVGKSSLLNMLAGRNALAKVSTTPGHTRLINFFLMNETWCLVDLPGYGYARTSKTNRAGFEQMIVDYLTRRSNLSCVFVLIDSRHEPQVIDLEFVNWLMSNRVPMVLVFTKTDLLKPAHVEKNIGLFKKAMSKWSEHLPRIFTCSSKTQNGRKELLNIITGTLT